VLRFISNIFEYDSIGGFIMEKRLMSKSMMFIASLMILSNVHAMESTATSNASEIIEQAVETVVPAAVETAVETVVPAAVETAVETVVPAAVETAVETVVPAAVETAVETVVPAAVETAVETVVPAAVETAVETVVPAAVETAVETVVPAAVETAVETVVPAAVETAVETVVPAAVETAVETVVPAAVETAVETATEAVVEAAAPVAAATTSVVEAATPAVTATTSTVSTKATEQVAKTVLWNSWKDNIVSNAIYAHPYITAAILTATAAGIYYYNYGIPFYGKSVSPEETTLKKLNALKQHIAIQVTLATNSIRFASEVDAKHLLKAKDVMQLNKNLAVGQFDALKIASYEDSLRNLYNEVALVITDKTALKAKKETLHLKFEAIEREINTAITATQSAIDAQKAALAAAKKTAGK
jgi:hypothetical protein